MAESPPPTAGTVDAGLRPVSVSAAAVAGMATTIQLAGFTARADEPVEAGGTGTGPTPIQLLLGALASCTVITVRMYAERKGWPVGGISADVQGMVDRGSRLVSAEVRVRFSGDLDDSQRARLLDIAAKCPVHRALAPGVDVRVVGA